MLRGVICQVRFKPTDHLEQDWTQEIFSLAVMRDGVLRTLSREAPLPFRRGHTIDKIGCQR